MFFSREFVFSTYCRSLLCVVGIVAYQWAFLKIFLQRFPKYWTWILNQAKEQIEKKNVLVERFISAFSMSEQQLTWEWVPGISVNHSIGVQNECLRFWSWPVRGAHRISRTIKRRDFHAKSQFIFNRRACNSTRK